MVYGAGPNTKGVDLVLHIPSATEDQRCDERHVDLASAKAACEGSQRSWCGGITRDGGLTCGLDGKRMRYELRQATDQGTSNRQMTSWLRHPRPKDGSSCPRSMPVRVPRGKLRGGSLPNLGGSRRGDAGSSGGPLMLPPPDDGDRLGQLLRANRRIAAQRVARGPPAYERFPQQAFRYRDWGEQTRHGRGDAYPLYTLDTLRNLADHLFDASTGWAVGAREAPRVAPCEVVYSTLRPTKDFLRNVHAHIRVPYILISDTARRSHYALPRCRCPSQLAHALPLVGRRQRGARSFKDELDPARSDGLPRARDQEQALVCDLPRADRRVPRRPGQQPRAAQEQVGHDADVPHAC